MQEEITTYNQFLAGDVFGFAIAKKTRCGKCKCVEEKILDSCTGFYGWDPRENGMMASVDNKYHPLFEKLLDEQTK